MSTIVSLDDRQALVDYLKEHCKTRHNRMKQPALARALKWDVRHLRAVISEEAQHNWHIGTGCGEWAGVWWSVDEDDARVARRSLVGRLAPVAARVRTIDRACPKLAQEALL